MQTFIHIFNVLLSVGIIVYAIKIIYMLAFQSHVLPLIKRHGLLSVFFISLVATICSMVYSNVVGYPPCDLCWYQRIFMYPTVFMTFYALVKRQSLASIRPHLILLTVIGGIISIVHNIIYYVGYNPLPCSATASCTARYVFEFGFATIPLMAFMSFALVFTVLMLSKKAENI